MTKDLRNLERLQELLSKASSYLDMVEYEWEEGTLTDDQENQIIELKDQMGDILCSLQDSINEIQESEDTASKAESVEELTFTEEDADPRYSNSTYEELKEAWDNQDFEE